MASLQWDEVLERFDAAANWWVATAGPAGPHAVPVWGVVVDGTLCFYGEPSTVRSRNLARDPRLVLHLESGSSVLVLHGEARVRGGAGEDPAVVAAYAAKYTDPADAEYLPDAPGMAGSLLFVVEPTQALAWELTSSADWENRRWRAGGTA